MQVGAVTAISSRLTYQVAADSTVRVIARLGTSGMGGCGWGGGSIGGVISLRLMD